jgi:TolB-like protein
VCPVWTVHRAKLPQDALARLTGGLHFSYRQLILCAPEASEGAPRGNGSLRYLFEDYTFDTERRELHRGADAVSITPQVFDLLEYLIRNRERVVSRDDLINAVWNGRIVSDAALTTRLNAARSAIGDTGEKQRLIKTLPRKGFRFVGTVREEHRRAIEPVGPAAQKGDTAPSPLSAPRLSIVVLPFVNLSADPEQNYFADGVTDSLTTDLSRISGLFVISRNSAFSYKGKSTDVRQVGREMNVRYVLEGSVQRGGNRLRVNVQLIDADTSNHLWAERFDKPVADLLDMQDEIVSRLANTLSSQLIEIEARRAERTPHPDAIDLYFQGKAWANKGPTPEYMAQARGFFERALVLDPENIDALVSVAAVDAVSAASHMVDDRRALLAAAEAMLIKALSIAPQHARAHQLLGNVKLFTNRAAEGISECERALALNRNLAEAHSSIGIAKVLMGRSAETEAHVQDALRLSPRDNGVYRWLYIIGGAKLQLRADAEAVAWIRRSLEVNRNYPVAHFHLAAALALLGKLNDARAAVKDGLALDPYFTRRRFLANSLSDDPTFLAAEKRISEGMRMAGVPEG